MANKSEEFVCSFPKRFKMDFEESECSSNIVAAMNSLNYNNTSEEKAEMGNFVEICLLIVWFLTNMAAV